MEDDRGWIKLHRKIIDTPEWLSEPFTRGQAWVDLLLLANHTSGFIRKRGIRVAVDRGQVGYSERTLGERWQWSRGKVRRFIAELIRLSRVSYKISEKTVPKNTSVSGLIYIINYEEYQSNDTESSTEDSTENGTRTRMKRMKRHIYSENALSVLSYLNERVDNKYRDASNIEARLKDGGTIQDCQRIIDNKLNDPYFRENPRFLNPETLFRKSHWDKYLNESTSTPAPGSNGNSLISCPRCSQRVLQVDLLPEGSGCKVCEYNFLSEGRTP